MSSKDSNPKDSIGDTKVPLWLLSPVAKAHWALGQFVGMLKYGAWNWRSAGVRASVYLSAAYRHLDRYESGEEYDPIDGTHHLGNVMACCAILLDARAAGKLTDDRPPSVGVTDTYVECEALMAKLRELYKDKSPRHYTVADTVVPSEARVLAIGARVRLHAEHWENCEGTINAHDSKDELEWKVDLRGSPNEIENGLNVCWFRTSELEVIG
jgi:hypothetical protein